MNDSIFVCGNREPDCYIDKYKISLARELYTSERKKSNSYYGHDSILKAYTHRNFFASLNCSLEHGIINSHRSNIWKEDYNYFDTVLVPAEHRAYRYRNLGKLGFSIGPFINYASILLNSNDYKAEKARIGRTLLVFPDHSTHHKRGSFSEEKFIQQIEKVSKDYETIRVCLYWIDLINSTSVDKYRSKGWEIVTAGHMYDPLFLNRLRTIIELSDCIISSNFGTNLYYSLFLKKDTFLFYHKRSDVPLSGLGHNEINNKIFMNISKYNEQKYVDDFPDLQVYNKELNIIEKTKLAFDGGFYCTKQPKKLKAILKIADKINNISNKNSVLNKLKLLIKNENDSEQYQVLYDSLKQIEELESLNKNKYISPLKIENTLRVKGVKSDQKSMINNVPIKVGKVPQKNMMFTEMIFDHSNNIKILNTKTLFPGGRVEFLSKKTNEESFCKVNENLRNEGLIFYKYNQREYILVYNTDWANNHFKNQLIQYSRYIRLFFKFMYKYKKIKKKGLRFVKMLLTFNISIKIM